MDEFAAKAQRLANLIEEEMESSDEEVEAVKAKEEGRAGSAWKDNIVINMILRWWQWLVRARRLLSIKFYHPPSPRLRLPLSNRPVESVGVRV